MNDKRTTNETIVLGSGKIYMVEFTGNVPDTKTLCVPTNVLGFISGGASLEYKPEFYKAVDDLGLKTKTILQSEEVKLKSGVMTWNGDVLKKLVSTGRVEKTAERRIVKIGGVSNQDGKLYAICFHHEDKIDGDIWVTIVGRNESGFNIAFAKDKETVVDAEFTAQSLDAQGTLIIYEEQISSVSEASE